MNIRRRGTLVEVVAKGVGVGGGGSGHYPTTDDELVAIAKDAADELQRTLGPLSSVVVLVSTDRGGHSHPAYGWRGACLPVIGLLDVGAKLVRSDMPETYRR